MLTPRLELVAASAEMLEAELESPERFTEELGAVVPPGWPPGLYDRAAVEFMLGRTREEGEAGAGWYTWYGMRRGEPRVLVLSIGYFGPPRNGEVQIGYSVVESQRGNGYATEAIAALAGRALALPGVICVCAHTADDNVPSRRALARAGFLEVGPGKDAATRRFERRSPVTAP